MRLLLISDATLSINAGGIAQTLCNIFSFIDVNNLLCISPSENVKSYPPDKKFADCYVTYNYDFLRLPPNRVTQFLLPLVNRIFFYYNYYRSFKSIRNKVFEFRPDIIVVCPNEFKSLVTYKKFIKGVSCPVLPYFMDDWMSQSNQETWNYRKVHFAVEEILSITHRWIMISKELENIIKERYAIKSSATLIAHNPVDISNAPELVIRNSGVTRLAYAGSLWDMHFDALLVLAEAVSLLSKKIKIELIVYTSQNNWDWREKELTRLNIKYGGFVAYKHIHQILSESDALVVVSSFSNKLVTHTKASLQTKVTDYLKCRKPVISVGPPYSVNHSFLKRHNCGVCIESNQVDIVAEELHAIVSNLDKYEVQVQNGWHLLVSELSKDVVQDKVYKFLAEAISQCN